MAGTFRFSDRANPFGCGLGEVVGVSGSIDASGNLSLISNKLQSGAVVTAKLVLPALLTNFATGTISVAGTSCTEASSKAIAVHVAPVTGSFSGPITPRAGISAAGAPTGTATLSLTQATSPAADGQFPLTGTLSYTLGSCTVNALVMGDASGVGVLVTSTGTDLALRDSLIGAVPPLATQVALLELLIPPPACLPTISTISSYTGTLTKQ